MKKEEKSKTVVVLLRALLDTRNLFLGYTLRIENNI